MEPVTSTLKSLYRLVLRACSATVLHQPRATKHLRLIYRPVFDTAILMSKKHSEEVDATRKAAIAKSLELWNERMDQSLQFLYNASHSRGLAHEVTKNLSFLVHSEKLRQKNTEQHYPVWDEKVFPTPASISKAYTRLEKRRAAKKFTDNSLGALGELVQMAESRGHMSLGRVILKRWVRNLRPGAAQSNRR